MLEAQMNKNAVVWPTSVFLSASQDGKLHFAVLCHAENQLQSIVKDSVFQLHIETILAKQTNSVKAEWLCPVFLGPVNVRLAFIRYVVVEYISECPVLCFSRTMIVFQLVRRPVWAEMKSHSSTGVLERLIIWKSVWQTSSVHHPRRSFLHDFSC